MMRLAPVLLLTACQLAPVVVTTFEAPTDGNDEANIGPSLRRMQMAVIAPTRYKSYFHAMEETVDFRAIPKEWYDRLKDHQKRYRSPYGLSLSSSDA